MNTIVEPVQELPLIDAAEVAATLESLPLEERLELWGNQDIQDKAEILPYLHEKVKISLLSDMSSDEISIATRSMEASDVADLLDVLPKDVAEDVFDSLDAENKGRVERTLLFEEEQAGRLINYDVITVSGKRTVGQVIVFIRDNPIPEFTDSVIVIGSKNKYVGIVEINQLLSADDNTKIKDLTTQSSVQVINPNMSVADLANLYRKWPFTMAPVVDDEGKLVGRITIHEMVELIQDEAEHQFMSMAGLNEEEDLFAPMLDSAKRRAVWLGINLMTAFLASWVVGFYQVTLEKVVALAVLMPVVASMGGIAGSQTLTLVIRGMALDQINSTNQWPLLRKELGVSIFNAVLWSITVSIVAFLWFNDWMLSLVIATALVINTIVAAGFGVILPLILKRFHIDPALSGSVILTTVTDVVGFVSFLGLGTWLLLS